VERGQTDIYRRICACTFKGNKAVICYYLDGQFVNSSPGTGDNEAL
jgi:hypothetical protein